VGCSAGQPTFPRPAEVPALDPPPSWADWNHAGAGLWPQPEDSDLNLNDVAGPAWIDDTGRRARDRLRAGVSEAVIGHCDWLAANLRWNGDELLVVHDWDSVTADSEALIRTSLKDLQEELDPVCFWPIHRSTIVNANAIAGVSRDFRGRVMVKLKSRAEKLAVSETHEHLFRQM